MDVCLNPACLWISLPWPFKLWNQWPEAKGRCPRCKGPIIIAPDPVLVEHCARLEAMLKGRSSIDACAREI